MELCIDISEETIDQLEYRISESEFESLDEYVEFVLGEVAAPRPEIESGEHNVTGRKEEVQDQLRSLGYLE